MLELIGLGGIKLVEYVEERSYSASKKNCLFVCLVSSHMQIYRYDL